MAFIEFNFYYLLLHYTFFTLCSGFVLLSSATRPNTNLNLFLPGKKVVYKWKSSVILNEVTEKTKNIGFMLDGDVVVSSVWGSDDRKILKIELDAPQLQFLTQLKSSSENVVHPKNNLESYDNNPFIVVLNEGVIETFLVSKGEEISLKNIKKGVASLFQIQSVEGDHKELDASGKCNVSYTSSPKVEKRKSDCIYEDLENLKHIDQIVGTHVLSTRIIEYEPDESLKILKSVMAKEKHKIFLQANKELGSMIESEQILTFKESKNCDTVNVNSFAEAIVEISSEFRLEEESLLTEIEITGNVNEKRQFNKEVGLLRDSLKSNNLGTKTANVFLKLIEIAKISTSEDISKALASKKNVKILAQLYDVLGYTQTQNSHKAVMKNLHLDSEEQLDFVERYLWALSFSTHPNVDILEDLLNKYRKYTNIPGKIRDTLILSLASMARNLYRSQKLDYDTVKVLRTVEETILNSLDYAQDSDRHVFINALKNLQSPSTIPKLLTIIQNGTLKEEVLAWRALKSYGKPFWSENLLRQAEKTLYQLDRKHDTSSRTLALDILLSTDVSDTTLTDLLHFVASNDTNFEIRQYVFQSIKMLSDKCSHFNQRIRNIIKGNRKLNNYSSLSPRGLSTALTRDIFGGKSVNASLVSVQEIKSGIVKRGVVNVVLDKEDATKELFTLGIFASGLSNFVSSNSDDEAEETSTAGMELIIMGTQIRPFVFFEGNGELMGHVWSGTASDMTPAFQALILAQEHKEYLRLGNGFIVDVSLKGAVAFDLSGKIEISIWNRNAQSLIEKSIGYVTRGTTKISTGFVKSQLEFEGSVEPKLSLEIDADFSSNVKLCMRLSQPNSIFRHSVAKLQSVPGSKYKIKLAVDRKKEFPGTTYALNKKNNQMCSALFS